MKNKIILGLVVLLILAVIFRKDLARIFASDGQKELTGAEVEDNVNDTVFGCEGYFDQCYEATFMGAIWYKSGLNTNIWTDSSQYSADQDAGYSILEDEEG